MSDDLLGRAIATVMAVIFVAFGILFFVGGWNFYRAYDNDSYFLVSYSIAGLSQFGVAGYFWWARSQFK